MWEQQAASRGTAESRRQGLGPPSGKELSALGGPSKWGVPAPSPACIGGGWGPGMVSDGQLGACPPGRHLRPHHRPGGGIPAAPPPMAALCFQCLLPKAPWAWVPEGGGRASGGGAGVQLQRRGGRGGHTQTHGCPCPGAEGGTLTTPGLGAASASWPVLPPGRPPKVREAWLRGRTRRSSARERGASWHRDGRGGPGCGARTPPAHPAAFRALVRAPARAQPLPDLGSGVAGARLVARASRGLACSASGGTGKEVQRCAPEPG